MARKVEVRLLDDTDGSAADETVSFALDGVQYEIDLSGNNARRLREAVAEFTTHGRRVGRGGLLVRRGGGGGAAARSNDRQHNQAIREWAKGKGLRLAERGRIPQEIVSQFDDQAAPAAGAGSTDAEAATPNTKSTKRSARKAPKAEFRAAAT